MLDVCLVEGDDEIYGVSDDVVRKSGEKFADGGVFGCPDGLPLGVLPEVLVEEEGGALVGKDDGGILKVAVELGVEVVGYELEKWCVHDGEWWMKGGKQGRAWEARDTERSSRGKRRTVGKVGLNFTYCVIVYVPEVAPDLGVAKVGEEMHVVLHLLDVF